MDQKPRVLQIFHDYKGPFCSVARHYAKCFEDCDVRTIFLRGEESEEIAAAIPGDVSFMGLSSKSIRGLKLIAAARVASLIGEDVPDILITHRYKPFFVGLLLRVRFNRPLLLGVMHEFGFLRRFSRALLARFLSKGVHLIGVSEPVCREIRKKVPKLSPRIHCISNALERGPLLDIISARRELKIPSEGFCFGTIGRLVYKKNHELLIRAFAELKGGERLAIVGDGKLRNDLEELVRQLGRSDSVIFCGSHTNAARLMRAFDAFVLPSGTDEAFGMVLLEAMAAAVPILSTDAPGPISVLGDGGLTFRSGDKTDLIARLEEIRSLSSEETAQIVARGSRRFSGEFSQKILSKRLRGISAVADRIGTEVGGDV